MKIHLILKADKSDSYAPKLPKGEQTIFLDSIFSESKCKYVAHNIKSTIEKLKQIPEAGVVDFANLSLAVYTADQLVSRKGNGYQDWSRYFKIYLPVENINAWNGVKSKLESMLSFLTGDKWELEYRAKKANNKQATPYTGVISNVSLFSGGLDSLIGAIDLIEQHEGVALISHHKVGTGESSTQTALVDSLKKEYPKRVIEPNYFYVQPVQASNKFGGEDTQRARSIMFIALGLLVANSYGKKVVLEIPENALISLNVPLTVTRYGSYSTKTTHPNFLQILGGILRDVSITNSLNNPYKYKTKGEMLAECKNQALIQKIADSSLSCSKPYYYRRWDHRPEPHCGHCVPCIIRRAAFYSVGQDKLKGNYVVDILKKSSATYPDLRAFKIGLTRFKRKTKLSIFDLFKGGIFPIHDSNEIHNYIQAYKKGMKEVEGFIFQK